MTDEDIPTIDTTMPSNEQGPLTRAQARQLNYQVESFLAVQTSYSLNGVLLYPCDDFLMLRNLGHEPDWRKSNHDNGQVEDSMSKGRNGPEDWIASLDSTFGPPGKGNFGRA